MIAVLLAHALAAALAPLLARRFGRDTFALIALVPAASLIWVVVAATRAGPDGAATRHVEWLPSLGLDLAFRMDSLGAVMASLVTAVGALVMVYSSRYFPADAPGTGRSAGVLMAFAGSMLGLVVADNTLLLYVFWELTTIFSYLLIGHAAERKTSRRAAMQALIVTTFGGLAMLVGFIVLGTQHSYSLAELLADPPSGTAVEVAIVLVLVGALSKSALFPTHFWLPAAMAAPTPVSAYLHAAAMVKAGVYLVARLAPGFAETSVWKPLVLVLGALTLLLGGWRALRQTDLKLLLAFGTVSQLGFLTILVGAGTREAALAGVAMLVAHATFKATLFLVVGIVDASAGTRDLRVLSGIGRRMRPTAVVAAVAAASMAGLPPFAAFVGKEAAYDAFIATTDTDPFTSAALLVALVGGSALTAAYSARFLWGAFATKPGLAPTEVWTPSAVMVVPAALIASATLVVGLAAPLVDRWFSAYADTLRPAAPDVYHLALWHGLTLALVLSALSLGVGALMFLRRDLVERLLDRFHGPGDADLSYRVLMRRVNFVAERVTAATQSGSLPTYLATILVVLLLLPGSVLLLRASWPDEVRLWDTPAQAVVVAVTAGVAIVATSVLQRLTAVILVGITGYGIGVLFFLHGAPDLALTQFLVESLTLVVFVLVLRKLPKQIVQRHTPAARVARVFLAVPVGLVAAGLGASALSARTSGPLTEEFAEGAESFGGGLNIVNVTLVNIRAWDTLGEVSVLVAAATGVASLVFLRGRIGTPPGVRTASPKAQARAASTAEQRAEPGPWLRGGDLLRPGQRSVVLEVVTRLLFHTIIAVSLYLLFSGHNGPGGGFAGGLVAGLALVVRYMAGGRYELGETAPVDAGLVLGTGLLLAGGTGAIGLLLGADVLQSAIVETTLPLWGDVKLVTSVFFDVGVYLIVLGLVLDILRSLGAELDRQEATR